ncbi:MAG: FGGY-family carbohydrate kinase, partial [Haloferula sp.]
RSEWMKLQPEVIYLTGGASRNDEVAQVAADVFGARVQRLQVSGSVALGGAMRAACSSQGATISALESVFCRPDEDGTVEPNSRVDYQSNVATFEAALS